MIFKIIAFVAAAIPIFLFVRSIFFRRPTRLRAPPPKAWRWEIYRAGNANPIKQSSIYFDTTAAARRAGKDALNELLKQTLQLIARHL
jgi:hypothetical protein